MSIVKEVATTWSFLDNYSANVVFMGGNGTLKGSTMTPIQEEAFKKAEDAASDLMSALYRVRQAFYENNKITPNGRAVWDHIPQAQDEVHRIQDLINKARVEALEERK